MTDWILHKLADELGVAAARAGESTSPHIRFEQPWEQWVLVFTVLGGAALIIWLYRREGQASGASKVVLAGLRIILLLLAVFMLSEAVLSVQRTGLPYLTILVDDSASEQIADQYEKPEDRKALDALAQPAEAQSRSPGVAVGSEGSAGAVPGATGTDEGESRTTRLAIAKGLILKDNARLIRELQKQFKVRIYRVSNSARLLADVERADAVEPAVQEVRSMEAAGTQTRLGDGVRQVLTELRGAPPSAIVLLSDGQTTEGEPLSKSADLAARKGVPLYTIGLGSAEQARDLELTELLVDDVVFVDDAVRFQATLSAQGFPNQKVVVQLKERPAGSDDPKSDLVLATKRVERASRRSSRAHRAGLPADDHGRADFHH